jgi:hypothetical protein
MEQYIRYRLLDADRQTGGWYTRLRSFVEWCERVGIDSVASLQSSDVVGYYEYRRPETVGDALADEMRTIHGFCQFLEEVGAIDGEEVVATVSRLRDRPATDPILGDGSGPDTGAVGPIPGSFGRTALEETRGPGIRTVEYDIEATEPVSTAIVRAVSAVEGRPRRYMPPLSNVVDPEALDELFEARSDGSPRTGGRLSIVYGSCRVILESDEYLRLTPLENVLGTGLRTDAVGLSQGGSTAGVSPYRGDDPSNGGEDGRDV